MLIEIAKSHGGYLPDLSFGTHFFQDLVESNIRYLPLYPDDDGIMFNDDFMSGSPNILSKILTEYAHLSDVVRVIDVESTSPGQTMKVLMNSDSDEAVAYLTSDEASKAVQTPSVKRKEQSSENHWVWRLRMAERIAAEIDPAKSGVAALYVIGSTKNGTAGPASDIDLIVHSKGTDRQKERLEYWFDAWSSCLDEINHMRTGYRTGGLLDVHYITDDDIKNQTSYAVRIGAATDPARKLKLGKPT
jgi:hypothetical protein